MTAVLSVTLMIYDLLISVVTVATLAFTIGFGRFLLVWLSVWFQFLYNTVVHGMKYITLERSSVN